MKAYYKKFGTFDSEFMCKVASNKYKMVDYLKVLSQLEPTPANFEMYENLLIELYEEEKKEKWLRGKALDLANEFYNKVIGSKEFKDKINDLYVQAEEIFKNE
jgi:hypothetical protein